MLRYIFSALLLMFTALLPLKAERNPASVVALAERIGGPGTAEKFVFDLEPMRGVSEETFSIGKEGGKVVIKGNSRSALTTGLGWFLNHYLNVNISWNSRNEGKPGQPYAYLPAIDRIKVDG